MDKVTIRKSQTVAEFIDTLKKFPQDLPIRVAYESGVEIYIDDEFYDGDNNNPKCPVIRAVIVI